MRRKRGIYMALKTYVGARYAPQFMGAWDKSSEYAALSVVYTNDRSFVSRKTVPANTDILNTEYWIQSSDWNAQVAEYNQNVEQYNTNVKQYNRNVEEYNKAVNNFFDDSVHAYDTKADMVKDESVKLGYTLITCGEYEIGDGLGSYYTVVSNTSANAVALMNGLYAIPFKLSAIADTDVATPQQYGAVGDGVADDTAALQAAFNSNKGIVIIRAGTYAVKSTLNITNNVTVYASNNAIIKAVATMDSVISVDNTNVPSGSTPLHSYIHFGISGGQIDGNNLSKYGIKATHHHRSKISNMMIYGFTTHGIHCKDEATETGAYLTGENLVIIGNNSSDSIGVFAPGNDEEWDKVSVINCNLGFQCGGNSIITDCTTWRTSKDNYINSFSVLIGGNNCLISNFTCDSTNFFMNIGPAVDSVVVNGLNFVQAFPDVGKMYGVTFASAKSSCAVSIVGVNKGSVDLDLLVNVKNSMSTIIGVYGDKPDTATISPLTASTGCARFTEENAKTVLARLKNAGIMASSILMFACDTAGHCCYLFWNGTSMNQTDIVAGIATNNQGTISGTGAVTETVMWYA